MTLFGPSSITSIIGFLQGNQLYSGNVFYLPPPVLFTSPYRPDSMGVIYNKGMMMIAMVIVIFTMTGKNLNKVLTKIVIIHFV